MKRTMQIQIPNQSTLGAALAACLCLGVSAPLLAAPPIVTAAAQTQSGNTFEPSNNKAAQKCLTDLSVFDSQMQKDGYWLHGYGDRYGYPIYGYSYDERGTLPPNGSMGAASYWRMRPGYEVRTLFASATILAQRGHQQECEALLDATRGIYKDYAADLRKGDSPVGDSMVWRRQQIAAAQPVTSNDMALRSDQLIGTEVVNLQNVNLGSVVDIVLSPAGSEIDYLVVGRGGLFGIDEKYVPVPWADFKKTTSGNLLVLDSTKSNMEAAPEVKKDRFAANGDFGKESVKVNDFWKARMSK